MKRSFLKKIKVVAKTMVVDRAELGELRLKRLASMLYVLISEKKENFDLIIGGGNSGIAIQEIVKMVYNYAGIDIPKTAIFPVFRPSNEEGVFIDKNVINNQLNGIQNVNKVLFVDDEIMRGQTSKICFESVRDYLRTHGQKYNLSCTIVAENHNFIWRYDLDSISVRFLPFAFVLQGYNCNLGFLMNDKIVASFEKVLGEPINRNQAMALLLGGKRKIVNNKTASFESEDSLDLQNKIENYTSEKVKLYRRFDSLVREGIDEYKKGVINFRYLP